MTQTREYHAAYSRDPASDAWLVEIQGVPGCQTYGRSLRQAAGRIREALAVWLDREPGTFEVIDELPAELSAVARSVARTRALAESADRAARDSTLEAARLLTRQGLSRRDTADILKISHQRVQQLLGAR